MTILTYAAVQQGVVGRTRAVDRIGRGNEEAVDSRFAHIAVTRHNAEADAGIQNRAPGLKRHAGRITESEALQIQIICACLITHGLSDRKLREVTCVRTREVQQIVSNAGIRVGHEAGNENLRSQNGAARGRVRAQPEGCIRITAADDNLSRGFRRTGTETNARAFLLDGACTRDCGVDLPQNRVGRPDRAEGHVSGPANRNGRARVIRELHGVGLAIHRELEHIVLINSAARGVEGQERLTVTGIAIGRCLVCIAHAAKSRRLQNRSAKARVTTLLRDQASLGSTRAADDLQLALIKLGLAVDRAGTRDDAVANDDAVVEQRRTAEGHATGNLALEQLGLIAESRSVGAQPRCDAEVTSGGRVRDELQEAIVVRTIQRKGEL